MFKLERRERGHFMTLIDISVHLQYTPFVETIRSCDIKLWEKISTTEDRCLHDLLPKQRRNRS